MAHPRLRVVEDAGEMPAPPSSAIASTTSLDTTSVASVAMLVCVEIHQWTARKYDKRVSESVARDHQSKSNAGRYNKQLVAKTALAGIQSVSQEARAFHYENSLPWTDTGWRILPAANFITYNLAMTDFAEAFDKQVRAFLQCYPDLIGEARRHLGRLYREEDYPTVEDVRRRFAVDLRYMQIPKAEDFRVTLSQGAVAAIQSDIERRVQDATALALKDLWNRVYLCLEHMRDRLLEYQPGSPGQRAKGVFHDTLVTNAQNLVELLPRLNMLNNPQLEAIRRRMEAQLSGLTAANLRADASLRQQTARGAGDILSTIADYIGETS